MPETDEPSTDEQSYEEYVRQEIEAGLADLDAGRTVTSDEIRRHFGLSSEK